MALAKIDPVNLYSARRELGLILIKRGKIEEGRKLIEALMLDLRKLGHLAFYKETKEIYDHMVGK